jgi:putative ABC transport system permease protein
LVLPTIHVARQSLVTQRANLARPARLPWWQRFNLDLIMLLIGGLFYWQVSRQGTLLGRRLFGELSIDPLQLLMPTLLMLASAIAFLRLFPILLTVSSRWLSRDLPVTAYLGLLYVGRNPLPYTRLILLLTLVTAVGFFVALFSGTLSRNIRERTAYLTGSEIRVANVANFQRGRGAFLADVSAPEGIDRAMAVYRGTGRLACRTASGGVAPTVLA